MKSYRGLLLQLEAGWLIITGDHEELQTTLVEPDTDPQVSASLIASHLRTQYPGPWDLVVAIRSKEILPVRLPEESVTQIGARTTQTALGFVVEEFLPWSAEDFVAAPAARRSPKMVLAVKTDPWLPFFDELRKQGYLVRVMTAGLFLKLTRLNKIADIPPNCHIVWRDGDELHYLHLEASAVSDWRYWPLACQHEDQVRNSSVEIAMQSSIQHAIGINLPPHFVEEFRLAGVLVGSTIVHDESEEKWCWQGARDCYTRPGTFPNLATGLLAGPGQSEGALRDLRNLLTAWMLFGFVLAGSFWWKSEQLRSMQKSSEQQLIELFRDTFPNTPVPGAVFSRFQSEHRKLTGARGGGGHVELPGSALEGLLAALRAHEVPLRSRFIEIIVTGNVVEIECEFRSHQDATQMLGVLEQQGLQVEPPQFHKIDDQRIGTHFRIRILR